MEHAGESSQLAFQLSHHMKAIRCVFPPAFKAAQGLRTVPLPNDVKNRVGIVGPRRLHTESVSAGREERLAHDRVLKLIEHVGGIAPKLRGGRASHFLPQLAPGGAPISQVAARVGGFEAQGNRLLQAIMHLQSLALDLYEWDTANAVVCVLRRRFWKHGAE